METMSFQKYFVYIDENFEKQSLNNLAQGISMPKEIKISSYCNTGEYENIWSARLSTGLFGLPCCEVGNMGPKEDNEVMLFVGNQGLVKVVELGFLTCPVCHPEKINGFWEVIRETVNRKYGIKNLEEYIDRDILPFDARRVEWETILPLINRTPGRLYVPKYLPVDELLQLKNRFRKIEFGLPIVGYYDAESPVRFTEYTMLD